jgi:hypothetical protein
MNKYLTRTLAASILAVGGLTLHADSGDALLNKLVQKGILTQKEAEELKNDGKDEPKSTVVHGLGMPDWVTSLRLYGDFRGRFEEHAAEDDAFHTRDRYRYRVRFGTAITMKDQFEIGFRVASGNPAFNPGGTLVGGGNITANQDMNSLESRKFLWIDAAYAKWSPIKTDDWAVSGVIGKFDNVFQLSNMIWDSDITPEGAGFQVAYNINKSNALKLNGAYIVLDELNQGLPSGSTAPAARAHPAHDPFIIGEQLLWDAKWTPKLETSLGAAFFAINSHDSLSSKVQPFFNSGNTRDADGFLVHDYNPIVGSASATYKFPAIPIYKDNVFPVKLSGEIMENLATSDNNVGWRGGVTLGKAGKRNTWEINYRYQRLEADAWFDALVDDDNTVYYAVGNPQLAGTGKASGLFGGTNVKGHQIVAVYSFTDSMNLSFIYYLNEAIIGAPGHDSTVQHFMVDLNWRF